MFIDTASRFFSQVQRTNAAGWNGQDYAHESVPGKQDVLIFLTDIEKVAGQFVLLMNQSSSF
ncbi:MAG: hypothetical protein HY842_04515 [Bacteroidetes bacterium]|nr:hypothetical protein [Bacteroidota bacterium]